MVPNSIITKATRANVQNINKIFKNKERRGADHTFTTTFASPLFSSPSYPSPTKTPADCTCREHVARVCVGEGGEVPARAPVKAALSAVSQREFLFVSLAVGANVESRHKLSKLHRESKPFALQGQRQGR